VSDLVAERIAQRIHREGPIPFDAFVEEALYGDGGFFTGAHGAGRAGRDFVTSPEVGTLFGAMVGRALDRCWDELGARDPFLVIEAGAGRGRLAADVLASDPRCSPALRYVLVERSEVRRGEQRELLALEPVEDALGPLAHDDADSDHVVARGLGPVATSLAELPAIPVNGVVLANELLDNLPFRVVERTAAGWSEVRVGVAGSGFEEDLVRAAPELAVEADHVAAQAVPVGARFPVPTGAREWLQSCAFVLRRGVLIVVDYAATATELVERGDTGWLRTYRQHERGASPLVAPGEQDITADVPLEYLMHTAARAGLTLERHCSQAEWLRDLGIDDLVAEARTQWDARAHVGDLEALRHRSRVTEAAALLDPAGLGAHRVLVFRAR
jgi:NADH dehydrogenase [ubiquinone] 1 alpha subcomplex assembly factor 7